MKRPSFITCVLAASALIASACGRAHTGRPPVQQFVRPSLATALTTSEGLWATVPTTTFWQLLFLPTGTSRWKLATPPGVADNGGLVISPAGPTGLLAAFRPSGTLQYTPLARESSPTSGWQAAGIIESTLGSGPAAVAAGPRSGYFALTGGGSELRSAVGPTPTTTVLSALRADLPGSGLVSLDAVAWSSGLSMVVWGGTSSAPGVLPVFGGSPGGVALLGEAPSSLSGQRVSVLDLASGQGGVSALLQLSGKTGDALAGAFLATGSHSWHLSPSLPLRGLTSAGHPLIEPVASSGWLFWPSRDGDPERLISSDAGVWSVIPPPPPQTVGLASSGGTVWAFTTRFGSTRVDAYRYSGTSWALEQSIGIPLQIAPG